MFGSWVVVGISNDCCCCCCCHLSWLLSNDGVSIDRQITPARRAGLRAIVVSFRLVFLWAICSNHRTRHIQFFASFRELGNRLEAVSHPSRCQFSHNFHAALGLNISNCLHIKLHTNLYLFIYPKWHIFSGFLGMFFEHPKPVAVRMYRSARI